MGCCYLLFLICYLLFIIYYLLFRPKKVWLTYIALCLQWFGTNDSWPREVADTPIGDAVSSKERKRTPTNQQKNKERKRPTSRISGPVKRWRRWADDTVPSGYLVTPSLEGKVPDPYFGQVLILDKKDDFRNLSMSSVLIAMNVVANERA